MLLATSDTVTPFAGAGVESVTGYEIASPKPSVALDGIVMPPGAVTVTVAVAFGTVGMLVDAVIVAVPTVPAVTRTLAEFWPAGIRTEPGTDATVGLLETRFTVNPPVGAKADRTTETACELDCGIVAEFGLKLNVAPTCTVVLAGAKPVAVAVIVAEPNPTPCTRGGDVGWD
jgi:hypothetical protein